MKGNNRSKNSGSYYIRVRTSGWFVWHKGWEDGKRVLTKVVDISARDLGFKPEWSIDQAKAHATQLNKERSLIREKIRKAGKRVTELKVLDETLFPADRVAAFQSLIEEENFGSEAHLKKLNSHFLFVQRLCNQLQIQPVEYKENTKKIFKYFISQKISPNYAHRITSLMNRWGKFVSKQNGSFFEPVPSAKARELSAIADAQQTKRGKETNLGVREASRPLTPEILEKKRKDFSPAQFNWLVLSVWLGLRPEEVDSLHNEKRYKVEFNLKSKIKVVQVYQTKLQSVAKDKRWKTIPIIFPEQEKCLEIIESGDFKRPLYKTMRRVIGEGISLYGGRKGFVDMMLNKGQKLEDISLWLGHKDISTTWQHYKDRDEVHFTPVEKKA